MFYNIERSTKKYFSELKNKKIFDNNGQIELLKDYRAGNKDSLNLFIESNLKLVIKIANEYKNRGVALEDLIEAGNIGLLRCIDRIDITKTTKIITYTAIWIRQAIQEEIEKMSGTVRLPHDKFVKYLKLHKNKDNTELTDKELELFGNRESSANINDVVEFERQESDINEDINNKDIVNKAISKLDKIEKDIIVRLYGLNNLIECSVEDISILFNIEEDKVKRIKISAMKKLKKVCSQLI